MTFAPTWFTKLRDGAANWVESLSPIETDADTEGLLDATTLAEYFAASGGSNRAQAVLDALDDPVTVRVYDGTGNIKGSGTMATPWATRSGATLTVAEVTSFAVTVSGTPDAGWYMRFESAGRWVRGSFGLAGSGAAATWSLPTWTAGQLGMIGVGTMSAPSATAPSLVGAPSALEFLQGTGGTHDFATYVSDPEGDAVTFALIGTPYTGISISTAGLLTVSTAATAALRNLTIRVTDTTGLSTEHVCAVRVASAPRWVGFPTSITVTQGGTYSFAPYAVDDDGEALTYSLVSPPAGYSINAATGLMTAGTTIGTQSVTVRVTDAGGRTADSPTCEVAVQAASSAVSIVGDTLTLTGSGFGTKTTPAPTFFAPLVSNADGQTAQAAGLNLYNTEETISPATACVVTSTRTFGQSKSLRWRYNGLSASQNTAVPIFAIHLPANAQSVLISGWFNISRIGTLAGSGTQLKMARTGIYGAGDVNNANNHYSASPHQSVSIFSGYDITWLPGLNSAGSNTWADLESTAVSTVSQNNPDAMIQGVDTWWNFQLYSRFNDIGQANGELVLTINNVTYSRTGLTNRSSGTQFHNWASVFTGFQAMLRDWDVYFTRPYFDVNTRAHVWLGNAATQSACTGRYLLAPTAWADGQIVATGAANRPSGYNWVYVTTDAGTTNSNGYAI